jgi:Rps23 Pro-64 3,4-dihydroxylase Tpa1-like proline 4-hydroxylase
MGRKELLVALLAEKLVSLQEEVSLQWNRPDGTATRHFVIDDLLPVEVCTEIYQAFPRNGDGFFCRDSFREKKRTSADLSAYSPILADITFAFQDPKIVELISKIVNLDQIEPDPRLYAGGLSMMFKDDFLNPHIDNSHDANRSRYRRLNLLYYVSPEWEVEFGGNFELWNGERTIQKTICANPNRLVVMETNKTSWHSVSKVTVDQPRCCVSNYYFSEQSPNEKNYFHVTSFSGRPDEKGKRLLGFFDNVSRNIVSKLSKFGRGKNLMLKDSKRK